MKISEQYFATIVKQCAFPKLNHNAAALPAGKP